MQPPVVPSEKPLLTDLKYCQDFRCKNEKTKYATRLLQLVDEMCKYEINPASIV